MISHHLFKNRVHLLPKEGLLRPIWSYLIILSSWLFECMYIIGLSFFLSCFLFFSPSFLWCCNYTLFKGTLFYYRLFILYLIVIIMFNGHLNYVGLVDIILWICKCSLPLLLIKLLAMETPNTSSTTFMDERSSSILEHAFTRIITFCGSSLDFTHLTLWFWFSLIFIFRVKK